MQPRSILLQPGCCLAGALPSTPALKATDAGGTVDGTLTAGQAHGLSKGTIAGIVLGSIAAATLLTTLIAFIVIKVCLPDMNLIQYHDTVSAVACCISVLSCSRYVIVPSSLSITAWQLSHLVHGCRQRELGNTSVCRRRLHPRLGSIKAPWTGK